MHPAPVILVLGSLNIDRIWLVDELPRPGETVTAAGVRREFGGKGANQAVAAARLGARVALAGVVGGDADGRDYVAHLKESGLDTRFIRTAAGATTGAAGIRVDARGENSIVIDGGANRLFTEADARAAILALRPALVVAQFEIPAETLSASLALCAEHDIPVLLNPSPVRPSFAWGEQPLRAVVVNETEARLYFGMDAETLWDLPRPRIAGELERRKIRHLVVTRGARDTLLFTATQKLRAPAFPVSPVDTVGAGDTFAGILAVRLATGTPWETALHHANVGAALATLKRGAQAAMPTASELTGALASAAVRRHEPVPIVA